MKSGYSLSLPEELYKELQKISESYGVPIKDVIKQCLKLGLIALQDDVTLVHKSKNEDEIIIKFKENSDDKE